jgi:F-type H+-transporting ATPase subunit delta
VNVSQAVARVYAQALFDMGVEEGILGEIFDDLHGIQAAADAAPEANAFLQSPKLKRVDKKRIMDELFKDQACKPVLGLLHVLIDKRREPVFDNIVDEFGKYRDEHEGRVHARVTTARPLPEDQKEALTKALEKVTGKIVDLRERINPAVIGGIRVNLGDAVMDGTILRKMNELRRSFAVARE